jgi:6-pyruvoyl-tetrahydropterin synthase
MSDDIRIDSEIALAEYIRDIRKDWYEHRYLLAKHRPGKQRTLTQNNALHFWCRMLADLLNASGLDMRKTLKPEVEIPWTENAVKENIWKPVQEAVINKLSTTEADRIEYSQVLDVITRHMASSHGVTCPEWPSKESKQAAA